MLFALAATVGLTFPPLSCPSLLLSTSLLFGSIPLEMGCRYLLKCLGAGSSQGGYFFGREQEIYSSG